MARALDGITAAILAGGLGTRLRSVVADRPKVLAPVAGRPFLAHLLDQLSAGGVDDVVLLVGYAADQVRAAFGDHYRDVRIRYSAEPHPLGTGGAIRHALPHFDRERILLLNGDSYCDFDPATLARNVPGVGMVLAEVDDTSRYGRVEVGPDRLVRGFAEKAAGAGPGRVNAGVYLFPRGRLTDLPADRPLSWERDVLPGWVAAGDVTGYPGGRFIDIGTPESFAAAVAFFDPALTPRRAAG
ncbi:MAG: nucleotidyltransferase family protein [Gemmataceae bacterium]|nr:nucleotidyltransferase family protein [Gemmataceae bacterium]